MYSQRRATYPEYFYNMKCLWVSRWFYPIRFPEFTHRVFGSNTVDFLLIPAIHTAYYYCYLYIYFII